MNTTLADPVTERRWSTYTKAVIFILPAIIAWGFACTFLVPKAKEISLGAGLNPSELGWIWPVTFFIVHWGRTVLVVGILALVLMEWVAPRWWRRQLAVGTGVWLANVVVLFALCMLVLIVLVAAPSLAHAR
jgi:hypothetical protein